MYATQQDIIDLYSESALLVVADRDDNDVIDSVVVDRALQHATEEIDSYVGQRHSLPLSSVPGVLKRICIDIALYRLSPDSSYTEEKRQRYEDAIAHLEKLASGKIVLGLPEVPGQEDANDTIEITSEKRLFNRRTSKLVM